MHRLQPAALVFQITSASSASEYESIHLDSDTGFHIGWRFPWKHMPNTERWTPFLNVENRTLVKERAHTIIQRLCGGIRDCKRLRRARRRVRDGVELAVAEV